MRIPAFSLDPSTRQTRADQGVDSTNEFFYGYFAAKTWAGKPKFSLANGTDEQYPIVWNRETFTAHTSYVPSTLPDDPPVPSQHPTWRQPSSYFGRPGFLHRLPKVVLVDRSLCNNWIDITNIYAALADDFDEHGIFIASTFGISIDLGFDSNSQFYINVGLPVDSYTELACTIADGAGGSTAVTMTHRNNDNDRWVGGEVLIISEDNFNTGFTGVSDNPYITFDYTDPGDVVANVHRQDALIAAEVAQLATAVPRFRRVAWRIFTFATQWGLPNADQENIDLNDYIEAQIGATADFSHLVSDYSASDLEDQIVAEIQDFFGL